MKPLTVFAVAIVTLTLLPIATVRYTRGVRPLPPPGDASGRFDREQSAALFVGVRRFPYDGTLEQVHYAVDDAVDLAHAFAMDPRVSLVRPERVVLALSGDPQKKASKLRLQELRTAGARVEKAAQADVLLLVHRQAASVGTAGLFILSLASHGFNSDGVPYVLASSSLFRHHETALSTAKLLDIANSAPRSLVFVDACRERVVSGARTGAPDPLSAAPLIEGMTHATGQVVFYAAAAGRYAYDDTTRENGVFTAAVLEGLQCQAGTDARGLVTVDTLATYVETSVRSWVRERREPSIGSAIQVSMDGQAKTMPLAWCSKPLIQPFLTMPKPPPPPVSTVRPARVAFAGASLDVFGADGIRLWTHVMNGTITRAEVADLDGDKRNEVIAAVGREIVAFGPSGARLWSADTSAPRNYDGREGSSMAVRTFTIGNIFKKATTEIVALSVEANGSTSRLTVFGADGKLLSAYWHPGRLQHVMIGRRTSHHAPKIIVSAINDDLRAVLHLQRAVATLFMLDPKKLGGEAPPYRGKLGSGTQLWYGTILPTSLTIQSLETIDRDNDGHRDIAARLSSGKSIYLDFDGRIIGTDAGAQFGLIARR